MGGRDPLPDEAFLVRGGRVPFARSLCLECRIHPDGYHGFSVQSAAGMSVEDLARALPNGRVGFTTAGELRKMGYDVVPTSGDGFHATVVVPRDWGEAEALELARSFRDAKNPNPKRAR